MKYPSHPERVEGDHRDHPNDGKAVPVPPSHGGGVLTGSVHRPKDTHFDPSGKPIEFTTGSVTDQAAGGDLEP